jgi:hypothetical protein
LDIDLHSRLADARLKDSIYITNKAGILKSFIGETASDKVLLCMHILHEEPIAIISSLG